jgi:hypothetical protein
MNFFKEHILGPLIVALVIAIAGIVIRGIGPGFLIHLLGGIADGDTVLLHSASNDLRVVTSIPPSFDIRAQDLHPGNDDASQKWYIRAYKKR